MQKIARCGAFGKAVPRGQSSGAGHPVHGHGRILRRFIVCGARRVQVQHQGRQGLRRQVTRQARKTRDRPRFVDAGGAVQRLAQCGGLRRFLPQRQRHLGGGDLHVHRQGLALRIRLQGLQLVQPIGGL